MRLGRRRDARSASQGPRASHRARPGVGRGAPLPPCPPTPLPHQPPAWGDQHTPQGTWASGASLKQQSCLCSSQLWSRAWSGCLCTEPGGHEQGLGGGHQQRLGAAPCRARGRGHKQGLGAVRADASLLRVNACSREGTSFSYFANDCTLLQRKSGRPGYFYLSIRSHSADCPQSTGTHNSGRICYFLVKNSWE